LKGARWKFALIVIAIGLAIWALYPTFQLYFVMPGRARALDQKLARATTEDDSLKVQLEISQFKKAENDLHKRALHLGLDLVGGMHLVLEVDKTKLSAEDARDAGDRALEVIRNRVDEFGVSEPIIQKVGQDRILVQLPGVDRERAKGLISQTAQLEFQLVADERTAYDALKTIDEKLEAKLTGQAESDSSAEAGAESPPDSATELAATEGDTGWTAGLETGFEEEEELGSFMGYVMTVGGDFGVDEADYREFRSLLESGRPYWPEDYEFLFGRPEPFEGPACPIPGFQPVVGQHLDRQSEARAQGSGGVRPGHGPKHRAPARNRTRQCGEVGPGHRVEDPGRQRDDHDQ
jgi:hypothetical protein